MHFKLTQGICISYGKKYTQKLFKKLLNFETRKGSIGVPHPIKKCHF